MSEKEVKLTEYDRFRNLIIGKDVFIPSWTLYKRIMLTGQISLFGVFFAVFNVALAFFDRETQFVPFYSFLGVYCAVTIVFLRLRKYTTGRIILVACSLLLVNVFTVLDRSDPSVFFFYSVIIIGAITIFGFENINIGLTFSALVILTFLAIFFTDIQFGVPELTDSIKRRTFAINFVTSVLLSVLMVYYIIMINFRTINNLRKKEEDLLIMTDELSQSRNRFELAIKGSSAGIWDWDPLTDKLYLSPLLTEILGYNEQDLLGASQASFFHVVHPEDLPMVRERLNAHLTKKEKFEIEFRIRKKNHDYIWVLDTGQAEWTRQGKPVRMVGSIIDITERKNFEQLILEKNELLEKTNKELDRFVYSVSHDLKSPLSSVLGLITITEMSNDVDEIKRCIEMMRVRINQLNNFIQEIIEYARNTRKEIHHDDEVDVHKLVDRIVENFEFTEKRKHIHVHNEIPPDQVISTDMGRLKIILNNLIGNAIKYHDISKDEPFIRVTSELTDDGIQIIVRDNGPGINKDLQEKVFEMFYRASETSDGSGLGLYIAREMAEKLKGSLDLESEPGSGTLFVLTMPFHHTAVK